MRHLLRRFSSLKFEMPTRWNCMSDPEKKEFWSSVDTVITDCDGVLWLGNQPIPGAVDVMNALKEKGKSIFFLTNNSTKTSKGLAEKSIKLGFNTCEDESIGTANLTALYLKSIGFNKTVYTLAGEAVETELKDAGIECFGVGPDNYDPSSSHDIGDLSRIQVKENVGAVVVGYDHYFSYNKLLKACLYLGNPDCLFIATNTDAKFPLPNGAFMPGCGSFVQAVITASGRQPIVIGKPSNDATDLLFKSRSLDRARALMIGDRLDTDIHYGNAGGMKTLLVLTGVTSEGDIADQQDAMLIPKYYTTSIKDLLESIKDL